MKSGSRTLISVPGHAPTRGAYSPAVRIEVPGGAWLFCTGQLALDGAGAVIAPHDVEGQTERIFQQLGEILAAGGAGFADMVRLQTYLTDLADFPRFRAVRDRYLADARPASTLIEVKGLAHPGCCVEVEATAWKPAT